MSSQAFSAEEFGKGADLPSPGKTFYYDATGWKILIGTFMFFAFLGCITILGITADIDVKIFKEDKAEKIANYAGKDRYKGASLATAIIAGILFIFSLILAWKWFYSIEPEMRREDRLARDLSGALRSGDRLTNLSGLLAGYVYPEDTDTDKVGREKLGVRLRLI